MAKVTVARFGDAALITIDNPPVNVIGAEVRAGLMAALDRVAAMPGLDRVIITGAEVSFVAGADAREFGAAPVPPHLPDILARIDALALPSIAAINGTALGGGLELALACRYRIATASASLGLPEVTLGVIPGAGGTQRLPRLIGMGPALHLIAEGRVVRGDEALALGLVDALSDDPVGHALTLPLPDRAALSALPCPAPDPEAAGAARKQARKKLPGQDAPLVAIDRVEAAATLPFAQGLAAERAAFLTLRASPQARALRHVFFAERAALKSPGPLRVKSAVVVGGGNMGAAIAYAMALAGIAVTVVETDAAGAARAEANLATLRDQAAARGLPVGSAVQVVVGYGSLPAADIAVEAAFEDMAVKQAIFARLAAALPGSAVLASNTSYLDINRIAAGIPGPERVLGLHFFSPAHIMKLLEIVKADQTSQATLAIGFALAAQLKKIPVQAGVCDGFIGNRILTRYRQTTDVMLLEGALPEQVDAAMQGFGMAMGPYAVQDLSGLDIAHANRKRLGLKDNPAHRYVPIADRMVESLHRPGRKTNAGWYDYPGTTPATVVRALIESASADAGIRRRSFGDAEMQDRALTAMVDEACRILDEGIARKPSDIDLVLVHGYGFPRWRGGLMHHADTIGLPVWLERVKTHAAADPLSWSPGALMQRLVAEGRCLADLN